MRRAQSYMHIFECCVINTQRGMLYSNSKHSEVFPQEVVTASLGSTAE